jgi:hypothetical protein
MKNKKTGDAASDELLRHLAGIARCIMEPSRTETTKGKVVKRKISTGVSYRYWIDPGFNTIGLHRVPVRAFRELGSLLSRIASGEDARTLFRQNERVKPSKKGEHQSRALAYWSTRALNPSASDKRAVRTANDVVPRPKDLSDATIRKIAQRYRQDCMWLLAQGPKLKDPKVSGGKTIKLRRPELIANLQEYLRKKSARSEQ